MAVLNALTGYTRPDLPDQDRGVIERAVRRIKLALMRPVWDTGAEGWGEIADFEAWLRRGEPDPPPPGLKAAADYYRYGKRGTP
jgi:hypothetical protein